MVIPTMAQTQGAVLVAPGFRFAFGCGVDVELVSVGEVSACGGVDVACPWVFVVGLRVVRDVEGDVDENEDEDEEGRVDKDWGVEVEVMGETAGGLFVGGGGDVGFVGAGNVEVTIVLSPLSILALALVDTIVCTAKLEEVLEVFSVGIAVAVAVVNGSSFCPVAGPGLPV